MGSTPATLKQTLKMVLISVALVGALFGAIALLSNLFDFLLYFVIHRT